MKLYSLLLVAASITACAEVAPIQRDAGPDRQSQDSASGMDAGDNDVSAPTDTGAAPSDASSGGARLTINEIRAEGEDWIELVNVGTSTADLSGWGVTDSETDMDARVASAARFPAGTTLAPASYLLVVVDMSDAGAGPQMRCLSDGGPTTCFHGTFGISASRGEALHLVDPSGRVVESVLYPMNAAMAGESWGRLPNGVGAFARNRLTPGATNAAP
ncbi:MAG: lamin tail domain-containing protein [Myxococcales bacterium]|nr:lamin tail domain-containing protein [Myxococcales bacterium]